MVKAINVKRGMVINYDGALYEVTKTEHITPGKGQALMQVELKHLETQKRKPVRFRPAEQVNVVHVEAKQHQYLYNDGTLYYFMDLEDYHTVEIMESVVSPYKAFLLENMEVGIAFHEGQPIRVDFPKFMTLKVTQAEPWARGDSVSNNTKSVTLETGCSIKVPPFINEGDVVKVDTESGVYVERV